MKEQHTKTTKELDKRYVPKQSVTCNPTQENINGLAKIR